MYWQDDNAVLLVENTLFKVRLSRFWLLQIALTIIDQGP